MQKTITFTHYIRQPSFKKSSYFLQHVRSLISSPNQYTHRRLQFAVASQSDQSKNEVDGSSFANKRTLYPAGKRQARVQLPALFITVSPDDILQSQSLRDDADAALAGGVTAVVLQDSSSGGAAELYEAAVLLKDLIRGRATLLINDRTDVVDASGADGALLSPNGLPTVVAKKMLQNGLALVGRSAPNAEIAVQAAADGCNFIVLQNSGTSPTSPPSTSDITAAQQQKSGRSVPIIAYLPSTTSQSEFSALVDSGIDGVCINLRDLSPLAGAITQQPHSTLAEAAASILSCISPSSDSDSDTASVGPPSSSSSSETIQVSSSLAAAGDQQQPLGPPKVTQLSQMLSAPREQVVAEERQALSDLLEFLQASCPDMEEVSLLQDALKQLDELFLLVVVGEFNSGK